MELASRSDQAETVGTLSLRPTRVRWHIVALLAIIAGLTYIDRLNFGIAGKYIQDEFRLNDESMGWVLGAFSLGYAIFHVPGGWLGDRFGPRRVLALAILWWSIFTAATVIAPRVALAAGFSLAWSFGATRFLMGLGEAAAMPVAIKAITYWLGDKERGLGTSVFLAGVGAGNIFAPFLITWMARHWGWRASFELCGLIGVVVAAVWYVYTTNRPQEHSRVNAAELAIILGSPRKESEPAGTGHSGVRRTPWRKIFSNVSVWALMLSHFCLVYPVYIFFTWFFIYLVRVRGLTMAAVGVWGSTPFIAGTVMVPLWGWLSDRAVERRGRRRGRRDTVWLGVVCSAILLFSGSHTGNSEFAILQLAAAAGFNLAASAILYTTCSDITRRFSGSVSGVMATFGSLGGSVSPVLTAHIATRLGWTQALDFGALVTVVSGIAWCFIDAGRSIDAELAESLA
jgi:MFS transporter, ACS family, glucarate transporter